METAPTNGFGQVSIGKVSHPASRRIAVIGAGLAGAAVCARFAAGGWQVVLIDAHAAPAHGASGNHAASFHPLIARDHNRMVRLIRAGIDASLDHWRVLESDGFAFAWSACGALQLSRAGAKQDVAQTIAALGREGNTDGNTDPAHARAVTQREASDLAGVALRAGGVWFGDAGWVQPAGLVQAQLASCGVRLVMHFGRRVAAVRYGAGAAGAAGAADNCADDMTGDRRDWQLFDDAGGLITRAPVVVLAGGADANCAQLFGQREWPVESVRGQITLLDANAIEAPRVPVHGDGYVLPCIDGRITLGATYDRAGADSMETGHRHNLARLARLLAAPGLLPPALLPVPVDGRIAARAVARDRLPVIGPLVDVAAVDAASILRAGARLANLPRLPGVYAATAYGSRGLTWAALGAELLLAQVEGAPLPLVDELVRAVDPGRFALRAVRHLS